MQPLEHGILAFRGPRRSKSEEKLCENWVSDQSLLKASFCLVLGCSSWRNPPRLPKGCPKGPEKGGQNVEKSVQETSGETGVIQGAPTTCLGVVLKWFWGRLGVDFFENFGEIAGVTDRQINAKMKVKQISE